MRRSLSERRCAGWRFGGGRCLGTALLLVLPLTARAQTPQDTVAATPAEECCTELLMPLGARIVALGGAVVADTAADMLLTNPAGISGLHRAALVVHYRQLPADAQLLGLAFVMRPMKFGSFAVAYTLTDEGEMPGTGKLGESTGNFFTQVHVLGATFATSLVSNLTGGLTYKVVARMTPCGSECQGGEPSGTTQMIDAGLQYRPRWTRGLSLGASVTNAGLPLQLVNYEQADGPPTRERIGATYEFLHLFQRDRTNTATLAAQVERGGPEGIVPGVGLQLTLGDAVSIRGGWRPGDSTTGGVDAGVALGVGLKFQRFAISVARALATPQLLSSPFQVTFEMGF